MPLRILLIRFGSFGDLVLTTPTCINLKIQFPDSHITLLTKERFRSLVTLFDGVDEILTIPEQMSGFDYFKQLLVGEQSYDVIIDLHGNPRSWLTRMLTFAPQKLVYPKRRLERHRIVRTKEYPAIIPHTIDLYNSVITQLGGYAHCQRPVIANSKLSPLTEQLPKNFGGGAGYICIAPEAAHATKAYPIERFIEAAAVLHQRQRTAIAWLVTKENSRSEAGLAQAIPATHRVICRNLSWLSLSSVLAGGRLTIVNDSGVAHLSSAVGTPVAALFGPTHPALGFAPRGQFDRVIDVPVWCRPCSLHGKRPCFRDHRYCFDDIPASRVADEAAAILEKRSGLHPALFIDRDGTLIEEKEFLKDPDQVLLISKAADVLKQAARAGFKLVVVSNQSGVARGLMSIEDVERVNARVRELLVAAGVTLDAILYCPEFAAGSVSEYARQSYRRKPAPGMIEEAVAQLQIDPRKSFVIGDKLDDLNLSRIAGAKGYLVRTGYGAKSAEKAAASSDQFLRTSPVCNTIAEVIGEILKAGETK